MTKSVVAGELFSSGFNCATSVLAGFCEEYELDTEIASKLACGLGGGCGKGEVCGAVSAAVIVVGLKYGQFIQEDYASKTNCYAKTAEFMDAFIEKYGAITCRDLLADLTEGDENEKMQERRRRCMGFVKGAADILEDLGY